MGIDQRSGVLRRILPVLLHLFVYTEIATAVAQISDVAHCRLDIVVDPASSRVSGIMDISAAPGRELTIYPNSARITELHIAGGKTDICKVQNKDEIVLHATGPIRLRYETIVTTSEDNLMSDGEIVLKYGWYPVVDGFCSYEVHAALPPGYTAVSEGETAETTQKGNQSLFFSRFDRPYPDAISLVAFKNVVVTRDVLDDIDIYAYFLKEDAVHADRFIARAKQYLTMYQFLVGKYPYRRLSIVETNMPSAFSMPTFVLMSKPYIRQEKIDDTPLGHEIVHQWFGNSVFADYEKGNWIEGLPIYFADHLSEELRSGDVNCRKRILIGYENYVRDKNVFPLSKFMERFDYASRSIGYGKSAMVFHMLRMQIRDDFFYRAVRQFVRIIPFGSPPGKT